MKINRIRRLEGTNLGAQAEKFAQKLALFSGIVGILALIFNLSINMKDLPGEFERFKEIVQETLQEWKCEEFDGCHLCTLAAAFTITIEDLEKEAKEKLSRASYYNLLKKLKE